MTRYNTPVNSLCFRTLDWMTTHMVLFLISCIDRSLQIVQKYSKLSSIKVSTTKSMWHGSFTWMDPTPYRKLLQRCDDELLIQAHLLPQSWSNAAFLFCHKVRSCDIRC
eukprot:PhF_6_TR22358/c1_g2_i3/m.31686